MIKVFYDGRIYHIQPRGGVNVVFKEIFQRIGKSGKFNCLGTFPSNNICLDISGIRKAIIPKIRPNRVFPLFWRMVNEFYFLLFRPHIFHSTFFSEPYFRGRSKTVLTIHDMIFEIFAGAAWLPWQQEFIALKKKLAYRADAIICVSESTRRDVLRIYKDIAPEKVVVIPHAVDDFFVTPVGSEEKDRFRQEFGLVRPYFFYVGRVADPYKNFDLLLDVYSNNAGLNSRFDLVVVGSKFFTPSQQARMASLAGKVRTFSDVSNQQLKLFYCCCHAFVYPSKYEGFGLPILEAMACGVPVITADVSSLPEVGRDAALYFNPDSAEDLGCCLEKISGDNAFRDQLIRKGYENIKVFSWDNAVAELEKLYLSLFKEQPQGGE
jgi:glycosyltransferase involved in cell wall biosynthesis